VERVIKEMKTQEDLQDKLPGTNGAAVGTGNDKTGEAEESNVIEAHSK
jgi:hypothetical protein